MDKGVHICGHSGNETEATRNADMSSLGRRCLSESRAYRALCKQIHFLSKRRVKYSVGQTELLLIF